MKCRVKFQKYFWLVHICTYNVELVKLYTKRKSGIMWTFKLLEQYNSLKNISVGLFYIQWMCL
jgi:hypothetical protein